MNILFFLTPKAEVAYLEDSYTIRQTAEKMFYHKYTSVPVLDKEGHYVRSVSDGDLFRFLMEHNQMFDGHNINIMKLGESRKYQTISHDQDMEDLIPIIEKQNYIPVLDDRGIFIGIITRKKVIEYLTKSGR